MTEHPTIVKVAVYRDDAGEWRFTAYAENGEAIVVSSEGYVRHTDARAVAESLWPDADVFERPLVPRS